MAVISAPLSSSAAIGRDTWRDLDWSLLLLIGMLSLWSCFTIVSATKSRDEQFIARPTSMLSNPLGSGVTAAEKPAQSTSSSESGLSDATKQLIWIGAGLALMLALALSDYQFLMHLQPWIYLGNAALLGTLLFLPSSIAPIINGAKSWIRLGPFALQPSEFCKFAVIICLAAFLCRRQEKIRELPTVLWSLVFLALPVALIMKQPDFGTTLGIFSIWFGMMFFGGARLWHLGLIVLIGALGFGYAWHDGKIKPYQKARLSVFLNNNPSTREGKNQGYQIKQSQIAIGSGQISGQGYGQGMQNRAGYVPENSTDFIFTVVAEELGFIGGACLIMLYLLLLLRTTMIALTTDNYFGTLIAGGFTALLAFHTIINLGMTMRVMPITGVPLPFFSYGGSSYLAFSMCAGLLQSIAVRQKRAGGF